jgi:hypothetical protein
MIAASEAVLTEAYFRRRCAVCGREAAMHRPGGDAVYRRQIVRSADGGSIRRNVLVAAAIASRDLCLEHGIVASVPLPERRARRKP